MCYDFCIALLISLTKLIFIQIMPFVIIEIVKNINNNDVDNSYIIQSGKYYNK